MVILDLPDARAVGWNVANGYRYLHSNEEILAAISRLRAHIKSQRLLHDEYVDYINAMLAWVGEEYQHEHV